MSAPFLERDRQPVQDAGRAEIDVGKRGLAGDIRGTFDLPELDAPAHRPKAAAIADPRDNRRFGQPRPCVDPQLAQPVAFGIAHGVSARWYAVPSAPATVSSNCTS